MLNVPYQHEKNHDLERWCCT